MSDQARHVDYRKAKVSALQQLAAAGDVAAVAELQRRGAPAAPEVDVTACDYAALRSLVLAWRAQPGDTREDLARRRELAQRAQVELEVRFTVDGRLYRGTGPEPTPPPAPPWLSPTSPRCPRWARPEGSKLYPSEVEIARSRMNAQALETYRAAAARKP